MGPRHSSPHSNLTYDPATHPTYIHAESHLLGLAHGSAVGVVAGLRGRRGREPRRNPRHNADTS
jgi:hypothetical protein